MEALCDVPCVTQVDHFDAEALINEVKDEIMSAHPLQQALALFLLRNLTLRLDPHGPHLQAQLTITMRNVLSVFVDNSRRPNTVAAVAAAAVVGSSLLKYWGTRLRLRPTAALAEAAFLVDCVRSFGGLLRRRLPPSYSGVSAICVDALKFVASRPDVWNALPSRDQLVAASDLVQHLRLHAVLPDEPAGAGGVELGAAAVACFEAVAALAMPGVVSALSKARGDFACAVREVQRVLEQLGRSSSCLMFGAAHAFAENVAVSFGAQRPRATADDVSQCLEWALRTLERA